jgi:hypothetical protein
MYSLILIYFSFTSISVFLQHNSGSDCSNCHNNFIAAETVYTNLNGTQSVPDILIVFYKFFNQSITTNYDK